MKPSSTLGFLKPYLLLCSLIVLQACTNASDPKTEAPAPQITISIAHSPDITPLITGITERFNAAKKTLGDGSQFVVQLRSERDIEAAQKIARGELKVDGWISSPSLLIEYVNSRIRGLGAKQVECSLLFGSPIVIAIRRGDHDALNSLSGGVSWASLLEQAKMEHKSDAAAIKTALVLGHQNPLVSGLGLSSLAQIEAMTRPLEGTEEEKQKDDPWQKFVQYEQIFSIMGMHGDAEEMKRYAQRRGAAAVFLTSEQQVIEYNRRQPSLPLQYTALYSKQGAFFHDFKLCTSESPWVSQAQRQGLTLFSEFVHSPAESAQIATAGFRQSPTSQFPVELKATTLGVRTEPPPLPENFSSSFALKAVSNWNEIVRPTAVVYVLDSSASMLGEAFERSRSQINRLIGLQRPRDLVGLVSLSFGAKIEAPLANDTKPILQAISNLSAMGGASVLDGLKTGYKMLSGPGLERYRKIVILVSAGIDTNSSTSFDEIIDQISSQPTISTTALLITGLSSVTGGVSAPIQSLIGRSDIEVRRTDMGKLDRDFEEIGKTL